MLMADPRTSDEVRRAVSTLQGTLDPVRLLSEIRLAQQQLVEVADRPVTGETGAPSAPTLAQFLLGLRTSWQEGEVRPTSKPKKKAAQYRRRCPDPFEAVTAQLREWFEAEPWRTSRELLERAVVGKKSSFPVRSEGLLSRPDLDCRCHGAQRRGWEEHSHPEPRAARACARAWRGWRAPALPRSEHRGTLGPVGRSANASPMSPATLSGCSPPGHHPRAVTV